MSNGEIDRLTINQLVERYDLVRSAVYTRMEALGIKPKRVGNKAFVYAEDIQVLDELHDFIKAGGTTAEFKENRGIREGETPLPEQSSGLSAVQPDFVQFAAVLAAEIAARLQPPPAEPDRFAYFQVLESAYTGGWLLSTSEIADLLDLLPDEIRLYGDSFTEAGFIFTKAGYRAGGQVAWRVSKPVK